MKPNEAGKTDWDAPLTHPKQTKWADPVGGPGRIPLKPDERLVRVARYVTPEDCARLVELGEGNISLGLRIAINPTWFGDSKE